MEQSWVGLILGLKKIISFSINLSEYQNEVTVCIILFEFYVFHRKMPFTISGFDLKEMLVFDLL